ncbi:hypothetical protein Tco_0838498 [Tanacetum coccineum]|uniref:Uncharacterized protein n=1 Tax=Tanacetum coccineum TaxID=301880 RepID=A0ABQ5ART4_9ASTR
MLNVVSSLHSDDVEEFLRHKMNGCEWLEVISQSLFRRFTTDFKNGKTLLTVHPHTFGNVVVLESDIHTIQDGLRNPMSVLASASYLTMANSQERVWLTIANGFGVYLKSVDGCQVQPLPELTCDINPHGITVSSAKGLTSPEQTSTGKGISNPLMAVMVCPKPYGIQLTNGITNMRDEMDLKLTLDIHLSGVPKNYWKLLIFDVATSTNSAVSFDAAVLDGASTVSAACIVAAGYLVSAVVPAGSSSSVPADYVSAGHVLVSADRDRIC